MNHAEAALLSANRPLRPPHATPEAIAALLAQLPIETRHPPEVTEQNEAPPLHIATLEQRLAETVARTAR